MEQVLDAMQFRGTAAPGRAENVLRATTSSPSCTISSSVDDDGVRATISPTAGEDAQFESEVEMISDSAFREPGTIVFGAGNRLRFSTVGEGYLGQSADRSEARGRHVARGRR